MSVSQPRSWWSSHGHPSSLLHTAGSGSARSCGALVPAAAEARSNATVGGEGLSGARSGRPVRHPRCGGICAGHGRLRGGGLPDRRSRSTGTASTLRAGMSGRDLRKPPAGHPQRTRPPAPRQPRGAGAVPGLTMGSAADVAVSRPPRPAQIDVVSPVGSPLSRPYCYVPMRCRQDQRGGQASGS
jgi:hypothetical protein